VGVRGGAGCHNHGLPPEIRGAGVVHANSIDQMYRFVQHVSRSPYLDLFGSRPFSKDWTIVAP
jgi:hypothetical protein